MDVQAAASQAISAREIYTVSRLNREAKLLLEGSFPLIWLEGEISNLARPTSGHLYFCLKDAQAHVRCALFRGQTRGLSVAPRDGMHVVVRARISLYEARGEFQLIVEHLEEAGEGKLRRAFEALKARLAKEGLFDIARKRPLPKLPRRIGLITSPTGAVVHDILTTLARRFAAIPIVLYPVPVQGAGAAERIAAMIRLAGERRECDVLILARGGGSLEDLWAFNEEAVARALVACPLPVVSGVGHETDFTIADLAADLRAPTPTAAAELASPDAGEWRARLDQLAGRLRHILRGQLQQRAQHVDWLRARLVHPRHRLVLTAQRLEGLAQRLHHGRAHVLADARTRWFRAHTGLLRRSPHNRIQTAQLRGLHLYQRLEREARQALQRRRDRSVQLAQALNALSPLTTLARGYAVVRLTDTGAVLRSATTVTPGQAVDVRLAHGALRCRVTDRLDDNS